MWPRLVNQHCHRPLQPLNQSLSQPPQGPSHCFEEGLQAGECPGYFSLLAKLIFHLPRLFCADPPMIHFCWGKKISNDHKQMQWKVSYLFSILLSTVSRPYTDLDIHKHSIKSSLILNWLFHLSPIYRSFVILETTKSHLKLVVWSESVRAFIHSIKRWLTIDHGEVDNFDN